jgi:hypothetical protein
MGLKDSLILNVGDVTAGARGICAYSKGWECES